MSGQVGDTFSGPVIRVADGDTISVRRDGATVRIRLDGIDTPESDQPFGTHASAFTSAQVLNKRVTVHVRDVDRYGRLVSRVQIDDQDLSVALVTAGLAWHYTRYSDDPVLARAEVQARTDQNRALESAVADATVGISTTFPSPLNRPRLRVLSSDASTP